MKYVVILSGIALAITLVALPDKSQLGADKVITEPVATTTKIADQLVGKTTLEKADIKSTEIAKIDSLSRENIQFAGADYDIEILDIQKIDGGVAVFARAWTPKGEQIGFGEDGSVDVERFLIYDPPILVPDPNGDIVQRIENKVNGSDEVTIEIRRLREDPELAIKQRLVAIIFSKQQKFIESEIVPGKVGNTTSTFNSAAGANSPVDGSIQMENQATWSAARDAVTGTAVETTAANSNTYTGKYSNNFYVGHGLYLFDTSAITDTDTISSATLTLFARGTRFNGDNDGDDHYAVYASNPAANNTLATADFDAISRTAFSGTLDIGSFNITVDAANVLTFNATGIAAIDKAGISKFSIQEGHDALNSAYAGANNTENSVGFRHADQTGSATDPLFTIEHAAGGGGGAVPKEDVWDDV